MRNERASASPALFLEGPQPIAPFSVGRRNHAVLGGVVHAWDIDTMESPFQMGGVGRDGKPALDSHQDMILDLLNIPSLESGRTDTSAFGRFKHGCSTIGA